MNHAASLTVAIAAQLLGLANHTAAQPEDATQPASIVRPAGTASQPGSQPATDPLARLRERFPQLDDRLRDLRPEMPDAYFELAEEIAALARADAEYDLAERLLVLAFTLDTSTADGGAGLRAPACLALASLTPSLRRQRWLTAIAGVVDPRYAQPDWSNAVDASDTPAARHAAATAIGSLRSGDGVRARNLLARPEVRSLFTRFSGALTNAGPSEVLRTLDAEATNWPCFECGNDRVTTRRRGGGSEDSICNTCSANPGWALDRDGLIATLRFESVMLRGVQRSWGAQLAVDLGAPLRDPDPRELAPTYGVDPRAAYWRRGSWTATP